MLNNKKVTIRFDKYMELKTKAMTFDAISNMVFEQMGIDSEIDEIDLKGFDESKDFDFDKYFNDLLEEQGV